MNKKSDNRRMTRKVFKSQKQQSKVELKLLDNVAIGQPIFTTYVVQPLTQISQGTSYNERVGLAVNVKRIRIGLTLKCGSAILGSATTSVRVLIIQDLQQVDSTIPTGLDIQSILNPISARNWFNISRFATLHDSTTLLDIYNPQNHKEVSIALNSVVKYSGASSANIQKLGIYLVYVCDNAVNPPTLDYWSRCLFEDL